MEMVLMNAKFRLYQPSIYQFYHFAMSKLRVHPRRTMDYSEAEFFVLPYDLGFAAGFSKEDGQMRSKPHFTGCPEYEQVIPLLRAEIDRSALFGHNIVVFNSLFDFFPQHCRAIINVCLNCTILGFDLEDYRESRMYRTRGPYFRLNRRVFSVPYPTLG
jgi:hypothetical protein